MLVKMKQAVAKKGVIGLAFFVLISFMGTVHAENSCNTYIYKTPEDAVLFPRLNSRDEPPHHKTDTVCTISPPHKFCAEPEISERTFRENGCVEDRFVLYYVLDNTLPEENYMDNAQQMQRIRDYLSASPKIDSITIYAYASPEGSLKRNIWLSERRAIAARDYLLRHTAAETGLDASRIILRPMGEYWDGLRAEIEKNYRRPDRDRVLEILDAPIPDETKKWRLRRLDGGRTYRCIIRNHSAALRVATWVCVWERPVQEVLHEAASTVDTASLSLPAMPALTSSPALNAAPMPILGVPVAGTPAVSRDKRTILALKTNMLYDLATMLNFAVEVPFNLGRQKFSIQYEHYCPWWLSRNNKYCLEYLTFGGELRWWFKPKPREAAPRLVKRDALTGHFLGLYGFGGKADFQNRRKICYQFEVFSVGLTYGYSMPLCKRLNIEFSLSLGYARIPYRHYIPSEDFDILFRDRSKAGTISYFGPTKAAVSLVVPILIDTRRKGGVR